MNSNSNIFRNIKNILNKKEDNYKYDDIIDKKLNLLKKNNNNYKISNFTIKRKIPDKNELKKVYNKFLKKVDKMNSDLDNYKSFYYENKINKLVLTNDNQYLLFKLNLKDNKKYILSIKFNLPEKSKINFIFNNNLNKDVFNINHEIYGEIMFSTNNLITLNDYLEFYIIFSPKNIINIHDLIITIKEINVKNNNITLLKNNNKILIY